MYVHCCLYTRSATLLTGYQVCTLLLLRAAISYSWCTYDYDGNTIGTQHNVVSSRTPLVSYDTYRGAAGCYHCYCYCCCCCCCCCTMEHRPTRRGVKLSHMPVELNLVPRKNADEFVCFVFAFAFVSPPEISCCFYCGRSAGGKDKTPQLLGRC